MSFFCNIFAQKSKKNMLESSVLYVVSKSDLQAIMTQAVEETISRVNSEREDVLIPVERVCEILDVTRSTLWRWKNSGFLEPVKVGAKVMYKNSDVSRLISEKV